MKSEIVINAKVSELFRKMREGEYKRNLFPELSWEDVPSLMKMAESERVLTSFPVNPISSQSQRETTEGIVALWLVEGIRVGGKFPSLNCMLMGKDPDLLHDRSWLQATALASYQAWWKEVDPQPGEESTELVPMADTSLRWY